jgi:hypothetical protein
MDYELDRAVGGTGIDLTPAGVRGSSGGSLDHTEVSPPRTDAPAPPYPRRTG